MPAEQAAEQAPALRRHFEDNQIFVIAVKLSPIANQLVAVLIRTLSSSSVIRFFFCSTAASTGNSPIWIPTTRHTTRHTGDVRRSGLVDLLQIHPISRTLKHGRNVPTRCSAGQLHSNDSKFNRDRHAWLSAGQMA